MSSPNASELEFAQHWDSCGEEPKTSDFENAQRWEDSQTPWTGSTKSPTAFTGPLGKLCETDHNDLPQVEFTQLSGPLDHIEFDKTTLDDLSGDQRLLLEYVLGISKGKVNPRFAAWKIWPLNHARWLTLAIILMCLWTRGAYPPELQDMLRHAVKYKCMQLAGLRLKESKFYNQQLYIFNIMQRMKQQAEEIQNVAFKNLKYNA